MIRQNILLNESNRLVISLNIKTWTIIGAASAKLLATAPC